MEIGFGKENNEFMIGFNHKGNKSPDPLAEELALIDFALGVVHAKQTNFSLTSLDRYVEEYLVNASKVRVIGDNYQNIVYSQDEKLILEIGKIMEEKLKAA